MLQWPLKTVRCRWCALGLVLMISLSCQAQSVGGERTTGVGTPASDVPLPTSITLANGEWLPYQSNHLKYDGVVSRIVSAAFADQGIRVNYVFLPWKRSYYMAREGVYQGTLVWRESFERVQDFWFSDPIFSGQTVLFHLKDKPFEWHKLADLKGQTIGETLGYDYVPLNKAKKLGLVKVQRAPTDLQNFEKLLRGRISLFPCDLDVGLQLIQTRLTPMQAARISWTKKPLEVVSYHLMLTRKSAASPALMRKFNQGLAHLRSKGLIKKWFNQSRAGDYRLPRGETWKAIEDTPQVGE